MRRPDCDTPPAEVVIPLACIFAVASGAGRAAVAVLRLSGAETGQVLDAVCGGRPTPRRASVRRLRNASGELLDQALVLWMPAPDSYTGEDCAELQVHGGHAVIEAVGEVLAAAGARPAEAGEFSRRAFLNGRMDLLEAEAVADLVEAETEAQRRQALRQLGGEASRVYAELAARLLRVLSAQEALVDFPDEDLPAAVATELLAEITAIEATIRQYLRDGRDSERLREGVTVAIVGAPNVGKSSLMNALCGRDVAIVSAEAGTTRDVVESRVILSGVPVRLLDTAGLRDAEGAVEREGVRRALQAAERADLVLRVVGPEGDALDAAAAGADSVLVSSKADLGFAVPAGAIACSAVTGAGIEALRRRLAEEVGRLVRLDGPPVLTRSRHRSCLSAAAQHLEDAAAVGLAELRAESLRLGYTALGQLTGIGDVDTILDEVFGRFCIGK